MWLTITKLPLGMQDLAMTGKLPDETVISILSEPHDRVEEGASVLDI
jgi:hypothetical protein